MVLYEDYVSLVSNMLNLLVHGDVHKPDRQSQ